MDLKTWLASTAIPKAKKDLAIFSVFADAVGQRPNLFNELERLVLARRLVILLGGRQSCLKEFLTGFQKNIEQNSATRFTHVTASFNSEHFRQIYEAWNKLLDLAELDCLFAALAFAAMNGLRNKTGKFIPPYLTTQMLDRPLVFARLYLSNAAQHEDHWQCIHHFLSFLRDAVQAAGIGEITIFSYPFEEIEEVINGNEEAHRQLWQDGHGSATSLNQNLTNARQWESC
ncbi:MAG: hypothetical protein IPM55_19575 [Acidobacteria bacterium]|nr:hypothetical protein [Acidobacteriota bacterium]